MLESEKSFSTCVMGYLYAIWREIEQGQVEGVQIRRLSGDLQKRKSSLPFLNANAVFSNHEFP